MKRSTAPGALLLQGAMDSTRLMILHELAAGGGVCACDFTACCTVAQPTVSHHLKVLRETGWVHTERKASYIYHYLRPEAVARFRDVAGELAPAMTATSARTLPVLQPTAV